MRGLGVPRVLHGMPTASGVKSDDRLPTSRRSKEIREGNKTASPQRKHSNHAPVPQCLAPPHSFHQDPAEPPPFWDSELGWDPRYMPRGGQQGQCPASFQWACFHSQLGNPGDIFLRK